MNPDLTNSLAGNLSDISDLKGDGARVIRSKVKITATGEATSLPTRCKILVIVTTSKPTLEEAKTSVMRRTDYIQQVIKSRSVEDVKFTTTIWNNEDGVKMRGEVLANFSDIPMCQEITNLLREKLIDSAVSISSPTFQHSSESLETARRKACLTAVRNSFEKAQEIASMFNYYVSKPLFMEEEGCTETSTSCAENQDSFQRLYEDSTIVVKSKVNALYEICRKSERV